MVLLLRVLLLMGLSGFVSGFGSLAGEFGLEGGSAIFC